MSSGANRRRLRILGVTDRAFPLVGGADVSMAILLGQLRRDHGHDCLLLGSSRHRNALSAFGTPLRSSRDPEELKQRVVRFRPDVMITSLGASVAGARVAERFAVPHLAWIASFELCPPTRAEARAWGVAVDREHLPAEIRAHVLHTVDGILTSSRFMQSRIRRQAGLGSHVVYPAFDLPQVSPRRGHAPHGRYVTGLCGNAYQGADIFLRLAERMPDVEFQLVGRLTPACQARAAALTNVTTRPFSPPRNFLASSRAVLVPSQWPEPFGRIAVEAMASGIPTLVSRTGGLTEIAGAGELSVRSFRSVDAWQRALERVLIQPPATQRLAREGCRRVKRFLGGRSVETVDRLAWRLASRKHPRWDGPRLVVVAGSTASKTAYAMINDQWSRADFGPRLRVVARDPEMADCLAADVRIRSDLTRDFEDWPAPVDGHLIAVRTWDFGPYPPAWVKTITERYDRLWVHTRWVRRQAIASGIPADRVAVVPLGVDPRIFRPDGPRFGLATRKRFVALFVGAPVPRKGFDILVRAWVTAFRRADDVCLIVKANPDDVFYAGAECREELEAALRDPDAPEIHVVDRFLPASRLASLYRAADITVCPYRAEGFCLPLIESMACGTPVVAPRFGAALDFCSNRTSFLVPARRVAVPVGRRMAINTLGLEQDIDAVDFCEVDSDRLASELHAIASTPRRVRAAKAAHGLDVARRFSWQASAATVSREIDRVLRRAVPVRLARARAETGRHRLLLAARDLDPRGSA